jgi:hypothetical protein
MFLVDWKENNSFIAQKKLKASPPKENICYSFPQQKNFYMPIYFFFSGSIFVVDWEESNSFIAQKKQKNDLKKTYAILSPNKKIYMPIYFFFQGPSLRIIEKKDSFIHSSSPPPAPPPQQSQRIP